MTLVQKSIEQTQFYDTTLHHYSSRYSALSTVIATLFSPACLALSVLLEKFGGLTAGSGRANSLVKIIRREGKQEKYARLQDRVNNNLYFGPLTYFVLDETFFVIDVFYDYEDVD